MSSRPVGPIGPVSPAGPRGEIEVGGAGFTGFDGRGRLTRYSRSGRYTRAEWATGAARSYRLVISFMFLVFVLLLLGVGARGPSARPRERRWVRRRDRPSSSCWALLGQAGVVGSAGAVGAAGPVCVADTVGAVGPPTGRSVAFGVLVLRRIFLLNLFRWVCSFNLFQGLVAPGNPGWTVPFPFLLGQPDSAELTRLYVKDLNSCDWVFSGSTPGDVGRYTTYLVHMVSGNLFKWHCCRYFHLPQESQILCGGGRKG